MKASIVIIFVLFFSILESYSQEHGGSLRKKVADIVEDLSKGEMIQIGSPEGYAAIPNVKNQYYKLYMKLSETATDSELVALINHDRKTIVLYAYIILTSRRYFAIKEIFIKNITDTSEVWFAGGCTGVIWKVNQFMLFQLNPAFEDSNRPFLTQKEYDQYCRQIGLTN